MTDESTGVDLGIPDLGPANHLGVGGSANVFAATQISTGQAVAVKLLRVSADIEKERRRFLREQETLARLADDHGVVPILASGLTDRNEPYFLMPLMACSLQDRIDETGPLHWSTASRLMADVADTVENAHRNDVLHRDLKPGNILVDERGAPHVSDFGIAKMMSSSSLRSSTALGTPSFMPPERFTSQDATEQSDVYGLGATLAALITGQSPFLTGENDEYPNVMHRVLNEEPPALEVGDTPPGVADLVTDAMSKDPADRPASAGEFAARLRRALPPDDTGEVTIAVPFRHAALHEPVVVDAAANPTPRRRRYALVAVLLMLAATAGALQVARASGPETEVAGTQEVRTEDGASDSSGADAAADSEAASDAPAAEPTTPASTDSVEAEPDTGDEPIIILPEILPPVDDTANDDLAGDDDADVPPIITDPDPTTPGGPGDDVADDPDPGSEDSPGGVDDRVEPTTPDPPEPQPDACFSFSPASPEVGQTVVFTNCSTDATNYRWDFGDGSTSSSRSPQHVWTNTGRHTIQLLATGAGGSDSASRSITINSTVTEPDPIDVTACFTVAKTSFRAGESLTFTNCSEGANSFTWSFGDGQTSTARVPQGHTWSSPGSYTITLTASSGGVSDRTSRTVQVIEEATGNQGPDSAPQQVRCAYVDQTNVTWTWSVFERVDVYIVGYADGTTREVGKNGNHTTTDGFLRFVTARYQGIDKTTTVSGDCSAHGGTKPGDGAPPAPSGITCRLHDFVSNAANNNWASWAETWTWNVDAGVDEYILTINRDGVNSDRSFGRSGSWTEGNHNGASNSGVSLRAITAVANGERVTVNISNCLDYGGVWVWHPNYQR